MALPTDANGNEVFVEYPKMLPDGTVVQSAKEEAARLSPPPSEPEPVADPPAAPVAERKGGKKK